MTKLKPTHFHDPEPQKMDYAVVIGHNGHQNEWGTHEKYFEDHSAWKARNVKPEEPASTYKRNGLADWFIRKMQDLGNWKEWEDYFKALQHYEENRRRYADFGETGRAGIQEFSNGTIDVRFGRHDYVFIKSDFEDSGLLFLEFYKGLSISFFEQIAKENGIELKKL